ncbi:MAG: ribonuclease catalytic domain-containing protein [Treponema sp.]|nr:ribonuclease catalytic domain-containing protein [Treponema sp.]
MISENALVVYKNKPALVVSRTADKILISIPGGEQIKVREKDIDLIHSGPVKDFNLIAAEPAESAVREAWELLSAEEGRPVSIKELAELVFGGYSPASAWASFSLALDGLYFTGNAAAIICRQREEVAAEEKRRTEKQRISGEREDFLECLKTRLRNKSKQDAWLPEDGRFMQDVEALALGTSVKSRTMKDMGLGENPEDAHALLLDTGFWSTGVNPHPSRFGISPNMAKHSPGVSPPEDRRDLSDLLAFAIDNPWSDDPDDALSIESGGTGTTVLYAHIADPAAAISPDNPAEHEARGRGATLYLPEGNFPMLAADALPLFALGLAEKSQALTFKITVDENCNIIETDIFPSIVRVKRLTYENADKLMDGSLDGGAGEIAALRALMELAQRNLRRRTANGAVNIELPETRISISGGKPVVTPIVQRRSDTLVRECMLLAGEGAALWAAGQSGLAFPHVCQEEGSLPDEVLPGLAGSYQLRRCMKPKMLSVKPGRHWGLGLESYSQVTSPLRRYADLLAHIQIRAVLAGSLPLGEDEVIARLGAGEAAASAIAQAERASRNYWTMVYLSDKKDSRWEAAAMEKRGNRFAFIIPAIALETQVSLQKEAAPNEICNLVLKSVNIPRGEAVFSATE